MSQPPPSPDAAALARAAVAARQGGDLAGAEAGFRAALAQAPGWPEATMGLAWTLLLAGRGDDGLAELAGLPDLPAVRHLRAEMLCALNRLAEAEPQLAALAGELGLSVAARDGVAYNLAVARLSLGRAAAAAAGARALLARRPDWPHAWNLLGMARLDLGQADGAEEAFRRALKAGGDGRMASNLLLSQLYRADRTPEQVARLHAVVGDQMSLHRPRPPLAEPLAGRRLRLGYVSPDLRTHAVAGFLEPVLAAHDRAAVEVFCYDAKPVAGDPTAVRLRALAEHWRTIDTLDDDAAAALVAADRIDVLVDLAGHTADHRLGLFVRRPAPLQVTWLGYPETTGLAEIDLRLTDAVCDPPEAPALARERLERLPGGFLCWRPPSGLPPPAPRPPDEPPVFGCFGGLAKMGPPVIALWARLLHAVPGARLLLKARPLGEAEAAAGVRAAFAAHGIAAERLELLAQVPDTAAHLALYGRIHVALDTFPYTGTTTIVEALAMGVPVVSLRGDRHAGRVGASLLAAVGLTDLAVADHAGYLAAAATLAADRRRLATLRGDGADGLPARLAASRLRDEAGFTRTLEAVLRARLEAIAG